MMASMHRSFVSLGPPAGHGSRPIQGIWHAEGTPTTAVIATHYDVDFSEHYLAGPLARRGFGFLGWNTRFRGNGTYFTLDTALADIDEGARWLRDEAKVDTVVLLGNSGGASLMGAYQATKESGDLFVSLNAHPGRPDVLTAWMDPSVTDESDPFSRDPSLDMFEREPPFDAEFVQRYRDAQRARNDRITDWALGELEHGERVFTVHRTWADLRFRDMTLDPSDREPGCYAGDPKRANESPFGIGRTNTLRTWLDMWSMRESRCRAEPHLAKIEVPSLVVQSTADQGCFPSDAQAIFDALGSDEKRIDFVRGDHYLIDEGAREEVAEFIAGWIRANVSA